MLLARLGLGFNLLIVLGFAFDPHIGGTKALRPSSSALAMMNPDLLMGEELFKKTGAGNLFMVFGKPDVDIRPVGADQIEVQIRGLDVYDPTTQEIRSRTTDDIACWFIDTITTVRASSSATPTLPEPTNPMKSSNGPSALISTSQPSPPCTPL